LKWADVLRGNPAAISERGVHSLHRYLVRTMADDKPMTEFARELLTATGNTLNKPAANFYRVARTPEEAAEAAAQLFLGVRMQCAKCHNHPFEAITQTDYFGLASFFARVQYKGSQFGLDDEIVYLSSNRELNNPKTKKPQEPILFGTPIAPLGPERRPPRTLRRLAHRTGQQVFSRRRSPIAPGTTCWVKESSTRLTTCAIPTRPAIRSCSKPSLPSSPGAGTN